MERNERGKQNRKKGEIEKNQPIETKEENVQQRNSDIPDEIDFFVVNEEKKEERKEEPKPKNITGSYSKKIKTPPMKENKKSKVIKWLSSHNLWVLVGSFFVILLLLFAFENATKDKLQPKKEFSLQEKNTEPEVDVAVETEEETVSTFFPKFEERIIEVNDFIIKLDDLRQKYETNSLSDETYWIELEKANIEIQDLGNKLYPSDEDYLNEKEKAMIKQAGKTAEYLKSVFKHDLKSTSSSNLRFYNRALDRSLSDMHAVMSVLEEHKEKQEQEEKEKKEQTEVE